jgi:hypothetical protein
MGAESTKTVTILNGRNTYLLANFPDTRVVGDIVAKSN